MVAFSRPKLGVITGATSGIGRATARVLASRGFNLILIGRNRAKGEALRNQFIRLHSNSQFSFVQCDLSNLASVREAASTIQAEATAVDVLINNAGARFDSYQESVDGFELTMATNYLGHFLLTSRLLKSLLASPSGRIINVSSSAHSGASRHGSWLMARQDYDRRQAYARSKLANLLFTYELARHLPGSSVTVNAMHPGGVASSFARNNGVVSWLKHIVSHGLRRELISPKQGADTVVYLANSNEVEGQSGNCFYRRKPVDSSPLSHDAELARGLWDVSLKLCRMESFSSLPGVWSGGLLLSGRGYL